MAVDIPTYDAAEHGVTGDGSIGDAARLARLIEEVRATGGGWVKLPPGNYVDLQPRHTPDFEAT
jgi:hypothetical protein